VGQDVGADARHRGHHLRDHLLRLAATGQRAVDLGDRAEKRTGVRLRGPRATGHRGHDRHQRRTNTPDERASHRVSPSVTDSSQKGAITIRPAGDAANQANHF
jgi:hypothetical protein